jgi:serine/threonine protein kinase
MQWLHEHNVLHGDLKAANVMLSIVASSASSSSDKGANMPEDGSKPHQEGEDAAGGHELLPKVRRTWCYLCYITVSSVLNALPLCNSICRSRRSQNC